MNWMVAIAVIVSLASSPTQHGKSASPPKPSSFDDELAHLPKPPIPDLIISMARDICVSPVLLLGLMQLSTEKGQSAEDVLADARTFGEHLHDYQYATGDATASNVINALHIPVPPKGTCEYSEAFWSLSSSLAKLGDPYKQRKAADLLGIPALTVLLRGGETELRRGVELAQQRYNVDQP